MFDGRDIFISVGSVTISAQMSARARSRKVLFVTSWRRRLIDDVVAHTIYHQGEPLCCVESDKATHDLGDCCKQFTVRTGFHSTVKMIISVLPDDTPLTMASSQSLPHPHT